MFYINAAVLSNLIELDRLFCYAVPDGICVAPGMRVLVPFGGGNRTTEAVVMGLTDGGEIEKVKTIIRPLDSRPLIPQCQLKLVGWLREHCLCTYGQALKAVLPPGVAVKTVKWVTLNDCDYAVACGRSAAKRKICERLFESGGTADMASLSDINNASGLIRELERDGAVTLCERVSEKTTALKIRMVRLKSTKDEVRQILPTLHKKAPKQSKLLEILMQTGDIALSDLTVISETTQSAANSLVKKGIIEYYQKTVMRDSYDIRKIKHTEPLKPTDEQAYVINRLIKKYDSGDLKPSLIRGVTGSGKTEVFLQIISHVLNDGKQAIVLVPEISLTPQTVARFVGRFGDRVCVLHSGLSAGERYDEWQKILNGTVSVAVGARSAVFAPFDRLGIIIVDEEHEGTYKSENAPYYNAADVAKFRGITERAMVVFGSATPSVKSYYLGKTGGYDLFEMHSRHNLAAMPKTEIIDMCGELKDGNRAVFSRRLTDEIYNSINRGEQTILFLNRRGYNSFVSCRSCGAPLVCKNCSITLTYHKNTDTLKCHYCGFEMQNVSSCPDCGSPYIRYMGSGTEKAEAEIARLFGSDSYIRMDADTTSRKNSHAAILRRFEQKKVPILLGTQMVTKGLDFENVTLVGVLAADLALNIDDFRAAERTFSQLTQVCGRAGRGEKSGRALIQTYQPEHYAVTMAARHDYEAFYKYEIEIRKQFENPPFCDIIVIVMSGESEQVLQTQMGKIAAYLRNGGLTVLGPAAAPYGKIKNKYRWHLIIKTTKTARLLPALRSIQAKYSQSEVMLSVDINPNSMN